MEIVRGSICSNCAVIGYVINTSTVEFGSREEDKYGEDCDLSVVNVISKQGGDICWSGCFGSVVSESVPETSLMPQTYAFKVVRKQREIIAFV